MPYSPQPPASIQNVEELRQWVQDELRNISLAINETQILDLRPSFRAPERLRDGVIVYADGVNFNPGSGEGPYVWDGAAWKYMIAPPAADLADITADIATLQATSPPGLVFIRSQVASNTSQIIFTGIDDTYEAYKFYITRIKTSVVAQLMMQMSVNGGSTWKNTSNGWTWLYSYPEVAGAFSASSIANADATQFWIAGAVSPPWNANSEVTLYPSASGVNLNMLTFHSVVFQSGASAYQQVGTGVQLGDSTTCNAVRFYCSSGNMVSGRISMYGVRKA